MFMPMKGPATLWKRNAMMNLWRILALAFLCAILPGPSLRAQQSDGGPALGVARISLTRGEVAVQRGESGDSIQARANLPLVEGDYLTTGPASRAEVQLDYSNLLRLDQHSSVRLASLGHRSFLVQIERGTVTYSELRGGDADVDIETPLAAVRPQKQGRYRIEVASLDEVVVTARKGSAEVAWADGREPLKKGRRMTVRSRGQGVEFQRARALPQDAWDRWNLRRDRQLGESNVYSHLNRNIYGAEDLDGNGRWVHVPRYGRCWFPTVAAGWAPYRNGRWVWLDYYGWSWVSYDSWGWAPYHYGRWFRHARHGWGWYPGSHASHHSWRPALVAFFGYGGSRVSGSLHFDHYGWVPLAPGEPYYPWFGRRYGGPGRAGSRNLILVDNSINIHNNYRNAHQRHGVTLVDAEDFSRGKMRNARTLKASELQQARVMRGRVPVVPGRSSQGKLSGGTGRSVRSASKQVRYFSTGRPRRSVTRHSFSRQQQEMTDLVGSAGKTGGRPGAGGKIRSSARDDGRRPAATARPVRGPNTRPGVKASSRRSLPSASPSKARPGRKSVGRDRSGRSVGGRTTIRSSGKSAGGPAQEGKRLDRRPSTRRTLTSRTPSKVSAPAATRPRPGSSRSVGRSRPAAPKSSRSVGRSRPAAPKSSRSVGRSRPAAPKSSRSVGRSRPAAAGSPARIKSRRSRSPSSRPSVSVPRSSSRGSSGSRTAPSRRSRAPAGSSVTSRSRRSAPSARSSSPGVSSGSSGRSSSRKDSTRSRQRSKSEDRRAKDRKKSRRR